MRRSAFSLLAFLMTLPVFSGEVFGSGRRVSCIDPAAMAVDLEGDRLYVAAGTKLTVMDVSNPLDPVRVGEFAGVDNRRQLVVRNGLVYLVSRETGLRIIDCTEPRHPHLRSRFDTVEFATGIEVVGRTAFVSERINGVEIVDVSNPDRPEHVALYKTSESQSCRYTGGYLYSGEWGAGAVTVFDVHDLKNVKEIGRVDLHGYGDGLDVSDGFLYCSTGHDAKRMGLSKEMSVGRGHGLEIFSLADPTCPKAVGRVDFPQYSPHNADYWTVRVSGSRAFCADTHNGLFAVDVENKFAPKVLDRFCVSDAAHPDRPSVAISSVAIGRGCLYVTSSGAGLWVIPVKGLCPEERPQESGPDSASWRESYPTDGKEFFNYSPACSGQARSVVVKDGVVYAAFGDAGLHVLRIGEGGFVKQRELLGRKVYDCAFSDGRLLTAEGLDGFALYELDCSIGFKEVARRSTLSSRELVAFWAWGLPNGLSVLSGRNGGLHIVRTDELAKGIDLAAFRFSCQWDKYLAEMPLQNRLPVVQPSRGIAWIDLSAARPVEMDCTTSIVPRQTNGICVFDRDSFLVTCGRQYAFVGVDGALLGVPTEFPGLDRSLSGGGLPRSNGRMVVLTARSERIASLYDFKDRHHPKLVRSWRLSGNPDAAVFYDGRILLPAGHQGLLVSRSKWPRSVEIKEAKD